jgi:hypothetical protein
MFFLSIPFSDSSTNRFGTQEKPVSASDILVIYLMLPHKGDMSIHVGMGERTPAAIADISLVDADAVASTPGHWSHARLFLFEYALVLVFLAFHADSIGWEERLSSLEQRFDKMEKFLRHHRTAAEICVYAHDGIQGPYPRMRP